MQFNIAGWKTGNRSTWQREDIKANINFVRRLKKELADAGELMGREAMGGPEQMKVVRAKKDGTRAVSDDPFRESKDFLAGNWTIEFECAMRITFSLTDADGGTGVFVLCEAIPQGVRPEDNEMGCRSSRQKLAALLE
jgi:hypothetical protein